jgi:hypothetical protein
MQGGMVCSALWEGVFYRGFQLIGILALCSEPTRCYNIVYVSEHKARYPLELRNAWRLFQSHQR